MDLTNQNDPIYNDRCLVLKSAGTGGEALTLNEKRTLLFPNVSISCISTANKTCSYLGLDENNYAKCSCDGASDTKNLIEKVLLESVSTINYEIVMCYSQVFVFVSEVLSFIMLLTMYSLLNYLFI